MAVFTVLLLYASGVPLVLTSVLQQCGRLPPASAQWFWLLAFPIGPRFAPDSDVPIDLIAIGYLELAIPFFILSILWEIFIVFMVLLPHERPRHTLRLNDAVASIGLGLLNVLFLQLVFVDWGRPIYIAAHAQLRVTDKLSDPTDPTSWWACLVFGDFSYYISHWGYHEISWMWMSHVVHHSTEEYNLTTAIRQPITDLHTPAFLIRSGLAALLFPHELWVLHETLSLLYQFWIHTQLIPPLPTVELLFNTPSLHRVHHARNTRALGKNFGAIFSVWDRIFGTFEPELVRGEHDPLFYGIVPALNSWDPIWANFHHGYHMLGKQWEWHGFKAPFVKWTPPGGTAPLLGSRMNPTEKYDVRPADRAWEVYAVVQLAQIGVMVIAFLLGGSDWLEGWAEHRLLPAASHAPPSAAPATVRSVLGALFFLWVAWGCRNVGQIMEARSPPRVRSMLRQEVLRHVVIGASLVPVAVLSGVDVHSRSRDGGGAVVGHFDRPAEPSTAWAEAGCIAGYLGLNLGALVALACRKAGNSRGMAAADEADRVHVGYTSWYKNR